MNTLVSSANKIENNREEALEKSFTYRIKSNGPRIYPCGTPCVMVLISDLALLVTYCVL